MKIRTCAALLLAVLLLFLFIGCAAEVAEEGLDVVEDAVEHRMDAVEDAVESAIIQVITPETPRSSAPVIPTEPIPLAPAPTAVLTAEEAEAIALQHSGFAADQVNYLWTEYEIDDGMPQYDVQFHQGYWEYEYEIHAETGRILSFDRDD